MRLKRRSNVLNSEEWEDLCDECGKCCEIEKGVACPSLGSDNRCTIYDNRLEIEICLKVTPKNIAYIHEKGTIPDSCAYVRHMKGLDRLGPREIEHATLIPFGLAASLIRNHYLNTRSEYLAYRKRSV